MSFQSGTFLLFFLVVYLLFALIGERGRWIVLLAASITFYAAAASPHLLIVLGLVTCISYTCGICLGNTADSSRRKRIFWSGTIACVLILAIMKYLLACITAFALPFSRFTIHCCQP